MEKMSLEAMVKLNELTGKTVLQIDAPCITYNKTELVCKTRGLRFSTEDEIVDAESAFNFALDNVVEHFMGEESNVFFILSHEMLRSGDSGEEYLYSIRYAETII